MLNNFIYYLPGSVKNNISLLTKCCDTENNINIKKNPVQVPKERCSTSQKMSFSSNSWSKSNTDCITELKKVKINNINNVIIATLYLNYLVSKFHELETIGQWIFDILIINETQLDAFFPVAQFCINDFWISCRSDQNQNGSRIIIYIREDITGKTLTKRKFSDDIEALLIEFLRVQVVTIWIKSFTQSFWAILFW